jgi:hypothetical protein
VNIYPQIRADQVDTSTRLIMDARGWTVSAVEPVAAQVPMVRIHLYAPWRWGERTSVLFGAGELVTAHIPPCGHGQDYRLGCRTCEAWARLGQPADRS